MGVYTRFKKNPDGLRQLVELLETTPRSRRQKMIDVGMKEDPEYTQKALQYVFQFEDILQLPDLELSELLSGVSPQLTAHAIFSTTPEIKARFMMRASPRIAADLKDFLDNPNITPVQTSGGQLKMIEIARKLEKKGVIKTKKMPS